MGALGLKAAAQNIAGAFSAFTTPAAELENVAISLGVVMGNAEAAERLTGSLERMATNGVVSFDELRQFRATGTRNTELAATLATLGFPPPGDTGTRIAHEARGHVWLFPERSADGRYSLQERMARWADDAWCGQEGNTDPIAAMADAFWNLRHLRRSLRDARVYVQAQNGERTVLVRRDASAETWAKAEAFLTRR